MKKPGDTAAAGSRGLVMTIASDDEIEAEEGSDSESELATTTIAKPAAALTKAGKKRQRQKAAARAGEKKGDGLVDPTFSFDVESSSSLGVAERQAVKGWDFKSESQAARLLPVCVRPSCVVVICGRALLTFWLCRIGQRF